ncbi:MAG: hypothetical protein K2H46_07290 [Muribaculaceae bacterium]|nr:hypothetical protein [Muribaculaceae bacterium]
MIPFITSGVSSFLNGSVFPVLLAAGGIIYFGWTYYRANKIANRNRKEVQQDIINRATIVLPKKDYYVACAGSKDTEACTKVSAIDIQQCNFCDSNGKPLDLSLYNCYVVYGDSMKYAGINDNDFILVPKDFNLDSLKSFPEILVIRYREQNENKPLFKVRRAWYSGSIEDDLVKAAQSIMEMPKFNRLTQQEGYKGAEWMIRDLLEKRLVDFKHKYFKGGECQDQYKDIVISTTFDTVKKEIHFSIHPTILIVGNVEESYNVKS